MAGFKSMSLYRGLPQGVYVLFFANIVNSLGNFVWPLLTLLLTDKLGMSESWAGTFVAITALAGMPGSLIGGKLVDRFGRKKVFLLFRLAGAIILGACAFLGPSPALPWLLLASVVAGSAAWPALPAMVADLTPAPRRQSAFSLLYLGHNIGFAVGPMIAGFLYRNHLHWLFLGDALTTVISMILVARRVRETHPQMTDESDQSTLGRHEHAESGGAVAALLRRPMLLVFSLVMLALSIVYSQFGFGLPVLVKELFPLNGERIYGGLMSVNALTVIFCTALITVLLHRFRPSRNMIVGGFLYAVGFGLMAFIGTVFQFIAATFLWSLGEIVVATNSQAYVAEHTPVTHRGRFNAVINLLAEGGHFFGPLLAGWFIEATGVRLIWLACFILAAAASMGMFALYRADLRTLKPPDQGRSVKMNAAG